jgi:DNA-directed RNA polymerase specialized sigma24 family protein
VVLRHWLGLSVEEAARELGISTGTVKSHTSRGLAKLQEALDDYPRQAVSPERSA